MEEISKVQYGQEYGPILKRIAQRLADNQTLIKYLINSDLDPLSSPVDNISLGEIMNKYIKVIPLLLSEDMTTKSKIVLFWDAGQPDTRNKDQEDLTLVINVYCPFCEWLIAGDNLRPYAIMAEIRKTIQHKRINGLGEIQYLNFTLATLTEEMGCYSLRFRVNAFT